MRLLFACVAITAVIALAACGGDDDDPSSTADSAELSKITALNDGQYTAIEKVYVASLPLDDLDDITAGCKKALVTAPESYVQGEALERTFGKVVQASKTDSAEDDARGAASDRGARRPARRTQRAGPAQAPAPQLPAALVGVPAFALALRR